jgi:hypothetical protein
MLVLGIFILISGIIFSWSFYSARSGQQTISVTGSAKTTAKADLAKWTVEVYRLAFQEQVQGAYGSVASDVASVKAYFKAQGIADDAITTNTAVADQDWSYQSNGGPTRYRVHQEVTITSKEVEKVQGLAQSGALVAKGYSVNPHQPEYYVTDLPNIRVELLGKAVADAKARATEIAKSGGSSVGKISSASSGVVQVLAPNSTGVEDYGQYDTSTIEKEVSVTARTTFFVK